MKIYFVYFVTKLVSKATVVISSLFYNILHAYSYNKHTFRLNIQLINPVNCSMAGSPVHEILQARILEWSE